MKGWQEGTKGNKERRLLFSRSVVSDSATPTDCSTPGFPVLHYFPTEKEKELLTNRTEAKEESI